METPTPMALYRQSCSRYQSILDKLTPFVIYRWIAFASLLLLFFLRIILVQGYYVIAYALGIYLLNVLLLFLSPPLDPEFMDGVGGDTTQLNAFHESFLDAPPLLPIRGDDEFRPFVRRLPEFGAWLSSVRAVLIATAASMVPAFDVPVFWPVLVMYFVVLFVATMRRQIAHMIKYRYVPFDYGKQRFGG